MSKHARLGPSNQRWVKCPGSVREEARYPDIPGKAAIDGTGSHLLLEMCLNDYVDAEHYDYKIIGANHPENLGGWLVDVERIQRVQACLDYIDKRVNKLKTDYSDCTVVVESESKSNPGKLFGRDDCYGTCDITITCRCNITDRILFIEVIDYKDGKGWVNVKDNSQLLLYLTGKIGDFISDAATLNTNRVDNCRMTIVQPKTNPVVRCVCSTDPNNNFSPQYVIDKAVELNQAAIATDDPSAPLISGKHCQWCKANPKRGGHCVAATEKSIGVINTVNNIKFITSDIPAFQYINKVVADPKSLTSDQLSELLSAKDALMVAFDNCEKEIQERIKSGQKVTGYDMQPGRSTRKWNESEDDIVKKLKSKRLKHGDIYPSKLISPSALLNSDKLTKVQKNKIESELVTTVAGKLILKKVAHTVVQSPTDKLQLRQMFNGVTDSNETQLNIPTEISFL